MDNNKSNVIRIQYFHPDWCRCAFCTTGVFYRETQDRNETEQEQGDQGDENT